MFQKPGFFTQNLGLLQKLPQKPGFSVSFPKFQDCYKTYSKNPVSGFLVSLQKFT